MEHIKMKYGFTLMELMVTIIIIAVLAIVAVPQYQKAVERSHSVEGKIYLDQVVKAEQFFFLQKGEYTTDFSELDLDVSKEN